MFAVLDSFLLEIPTDLRSCGEYAFVKACNGCIGNNFGGKLCYHSYQNRCIIKWAGTVLVQSVHHCVIHHWKAEVVSILMVCVDFYIKIIMGKFEYHDWWESHAVRCGWPGICNLPFTQTLIATPGPF